MALSDWLYGKTDATHRIALDRLAGLVGQWLCLQGVERSQVDKVIATDYAGQTPKLPAPNDSPAARQNLPQRQARHIAA